VIHEVVLAMHDVMADLHVLQDLGDAEQHTADRPGQRIIAEMDQRPARDLEVALLADDAPDVVGIALADGTQDLCAQRVQLLAKGFQLLRGGLGHLSSPCLRPSGAPYSSTSTGPTGMAMQA